LCRRSKIDAVCAVDQRSTLFVLSIKDRRCLCGKPKIDAVLPSTISSNNAAICDRPLNGCADASNHSCDRSITR